MIFYFTGTGNSLYVADCIREGTGDNAISMAECLKKNDLDFTMRSGERIGFVFPTHCWSTPWLVDQFLDKLTISPCSGYADKETMLEATYTFAIITCGSSIGNADKILAKKLAKKGLRLDAIYSLKMVDNYVIGFDIASPEKQAKITAEYKLEIRHICADIINKKVHLNLKKKPLGIVLSSMSGSFKEKGCKTKDFHVDGNCTGCRKCESICPIGCIEFLNEQKPSWTMDSCSMCLGCINRCPNHAIQYGTKTAKRDRFVNEIFLR